MTTGNPPYVKHYVNGILINPLVKGLPYLHTEPNRRARRQGDGRPFSNKKGAMTVVTKVGSLTFLRYNKHIQRVMNKSIAHLQLKGMLF